MLLLYYTTSKESNKMREMIHQYEVPDLGHPSNTHRSFQGSECVGYMRGRFVPTLLLDEAIGGELHRISMCKKPCQALISSSMR